MPIIKIINLTSFDIALKSFNGININRHSLYQDIHTLDEINTAVPELELFSKKKLLQYSWVIEENDVTGTVSMCTQDRLLKGGQGARIVYDTDLNALYYWRNNSKTWEIISTGSSTIINKTRLNITGIIANNTTFSVIASGINYTKTLQNGNLQISVALFRSTNSIKIELNGINLDKETDILWINSQNFQLINYTCYPTDIITIYSE